MDKITERPYNNARMIQMQILKGSLKMGYGGKERERTPEADVPYAVAVTFSGPHWLRLEDIPTRICHWDEDSFALTPLAIARTSFEIPTRDMFFPRSFWDAFYLRWLSSKVRFCESPTFVNIDGGIFLWGRETKGNSEPLTIAVWPFELPDLLPHRDFMEVDKMAAMLVDYAKTTAEPYKKASDIPGWENFPPALECAKKNPAPDFITSQAKIFGVSI